MPSLECDRRKAASTFSTLLLALGIIAVAGWLAIPTLYNGHDRRITIAEAMIGPNGPIGKALAAYEHDMGQYPDSVTGLAALFEAPSGTAKGRYRGPYLRDMSELEDPWGNALAYRAPDRFNKSSYDLYSFGPNGKDKLGAEGSDDINNW